MPHPKNPMGSRTLVATIAVIVAALFTAGCRLITGPSARPPVEGAFERTDARVARGEYLFRHVADCAGCHAMIDPATQALDRRLPVAGGAVYDERHGLPGKVPVPNITPDKETGVGAWTDGELLRAIREGVRPDGRALWPMMPYGSCFRHMSDEDGMALVVYMRTLAPVKNVVPKRDLDFPVNFIVNTFPEPLAGPVPAPGASDLERGQYLVRIAGCAECHTPRDKRGTPLPGMTLAGGNEIRLLDLGPNDAPIRMPNITPDKETGIGAWTDEQLRAAIQDGVRPDGSKLAEQGPAAIFHDLRAEDVRAMIAYLRSVPPVRNPKAVRNVARR